MTIKIKKLPIPFKHVLLIALALIVVFVIKDYIKFLMWRQYKVFDWVQAISIPFVNYTLWAFLSVIVYNLMLTFPIKRGITLKMVGYHLGFSLALALLHEVISNLMYISIILLFYPIENVNSFLLMRMNTIPYAIADRMIEYWIILGIFVAIYYFRRFKDKEVEVLMMENELNNAQLKALKMQLQPHFLFNALNTVSALISTNGKEAQKVLSRLGSLLRTMLDQNQKNYSTLTEEIEYTKNYLDIEQTRFMDRLQVTYTIDSETNNAIVPYLILQPLVENAIKHGFANQTEGGSIYIRSRIEERRLVLEVEDDGNGCNHCDQLETNQGIGLSNTRSRLQTMYGDSFTFNINSTLGSGFKVQLSIPLSYVLTS
jgi:two-component system LytT family sensor kinase